MAEPGGISPPNRHTTRRRRSAFGIVTVVMALIAGLVVAAVAADGRELSRASANDGGAWVVSRQHAAVAHKNRATGELSSFVRLTDSPTADVFQANDMVVVHDSSTNQLFEVDPRSSNLDQAPTQLPEFAEVVAIDDAVVVYRASPLAVWVIGGGELAGLESLVDRAPLIESADPGQVAASADGRIVVVDSVAMTVQWIAPDRSISEPITLALEGTVIDVSIIDGSAVVLSDAGEIIVVGASGVESAHDWQAIAGSSSDLVQLQRPAVADNPSNQAPATSVAAVTSTGELVELGFSNGEVSVLRRAQLGGSSPVAPIAHEGCIYGVVTNPPTFGALCNELVLQPLPGAGEQLRLRLVNGWVWVNDVESGMTFATNDELQLEALDDWSLAIETPAEEPDEDQAAPDEPAGDDVTIVDDPDAIGEVQDSDDFTLGEANEPPVAVDDLAETRTDVVTVVKVLANDTDPNNDVLTVTETELLQGEAAIVITADRSATQVTPGPGFSGEVQYRYSITDGRSEPVSAIVTVQVVGSDTNNPPITETDVVATAPGQPATIDVLRNDYDPDGDAIVLVGIETDTGTLRWDPSGQVTFTPDATTEAGWIELPYVIADTLGADADGRVRIEIRDRGANQEPDARNDQATTVVGRPVVIDLLANDSDPDGDALIVGSLPRLLEPEGADVRTSSSADGEFVFAADVPGTYLFSYTINDSAPDGSESDTARIRIDVFPNDDNEPPVAVRDDVVIPVGESRIVYVLENDGDPDGDVIAIVNWQVSPGLLVSEFNDDTGHVGFEITLTPAAGLTPSMTYSISDGVNGDVSAPVAIAVASRTPQNQPPLAEADVKEMRAGQTVEVFVLKNDFDPEGEPLRIKSVGRTDLASVTIADDESSLIVSVPDDAVSSFTVPYDIEDPAGNRAAALLRVQLINPSAANRPPVARTDIARTQFGQPVAISVLANDYDLDSDPVVLDGIIEQPTRGSVRASQDGSIVYTPDPAFRGTDVFTYAIVDGPGDRALGEVFVGVMEQERQNLPPIANDDSYQLNSPAKTPLDVLANDRDPEGDPLRVIDVSAAQLGTVTLENLIVTYQPPASMPEAGVDTFTYRIADSAGNPAQATVTIELGAYQAIEDQVDPETDLGPEATPTPVPDEPEAQPTPTVAATPEADENQPPVARDDDPPRARAGTEIVVDVLDNDFDPDGAPGGLEVEFVGDGATTDGVRVFVKVGEEAVQIPYRIADEFGATDTAMINIVVTENQPPEITPLEVATEFETPITLDLAAQVSDIDGDELFFVCCDSPRGGSVEVDSAGADQLVVTFTPETDFVGQAAFSFTADDQKGHRPSGSVAITVGAPGNRPPEVIGESILLPQRAPIVVDFAQFVTDPDDDELTYTFLQSSESQVSVAFNGAQATVTADEALDAGVVGFFTYQVSDGVLTTDGRIDFEISEGENRPPQVTNTAVQVKAASSESVDLRPLTTELDIRDSVTWTLEPVASSQISADLSEPLVTISAQSSASGAIADVQFTATDTRGASTTGTITVTVVDTEAPPPSAQPDQGPRAQPGIQVEIDVLANDSDPLLEGLEIESLTAPTFGSAAITIDDKVVFVAGDGEVGTATMTYTIRDQAGREDSALITVDVVSEPDQPSPPTVDVGAEQLTISWETPQLNGSILQGYRVTPNIGDPREIAVQNSYVWDGLTNGTEYSFSITALSDLGESEESDASDLAIPNQVPEAPAVRSVTFQDSALLVEWDEPTNLGTRITDYEVRLGGNITGVRQTGGAEFILWDELENGDNYTFEVAAKNDAGWSVFGPSSAPEHPAAPPDIPAIGTTVRTQESGVLEVNWSVPNSNNGDPVIEYLVRVAPSGVPVSVPGENTVSTEWSNLQNGIDTAFQVRARNRAGLSDWSAVSNQVKPCGRPDAPTIASAVRGDTLATITWNEPASNGCGIIGYWLSAVGSANELPEATLSRSYPGLMNGQPYRFTVQAENVQGRSVLSAESAEVTPAGPPIFCQASGAITATAVAPGEISVGWDAASANGDAAGVDYEVRTNGGTWVPSGQSTVYPATGLANDTTYSFEVRARNTVDFAADTCGPVNARTWALPSPIAQTVTYDSGTGVLRIISTASASPDTPVTSYRLTVLKDGAPFGAPITDVPNWPSVEDNVLGPDDDGTYSATAQVCNAVGCVDSVSSPLVVVTPNPPEPVEASEIIITEPFVRDAQGKFIGVELGLKVAMQIGGEPVTTYNYEVERRRSDQTAWTPIAAGSEPFTADLLTFPWTPVDVDDQLLGYSDHPSGVNQGLAYTWRVKVQAVNDVGISVWSPWVTELADRPSPQVRMVVVHHTPSTVGNDPDGSTQSYYIDAELYGFPPNTDYEFNVFPSQPGGHFRNDGNGDPRSSVGSGSFCGGTTTTNADGYIMAGNGTLTIGSSGPYTFYCISPMGSQVQLRTSDGYSSVWYPPQ